MHSACNNICGSLLSGKKKSGTLVCKIGEGGGGVLDRRDVLDLMHGPSRMAIDPRILTLPGRSMSGFHRPGRHRLDQARNAVRCPASRMKGELHPTIRTACEADLHMDDSFNEFIDSPVWALPETAMGVLCTCLLGVPYQKHHVIRSFSLCGAKVLHLTQII